MKTLSFFLVLLALVVATADLHAQIPRTLSYQGVFTDTLGNPKPDGVYTFTFRLYETPAGGTALWTEVKDLQVRRGLFFTMLGDVTPLGSNAAFDRPYWLGVKPGSDPELSPRVPLSMVGYSFTAIKADTARYALNAPVQAVVDSARIAGTIPNNTVSTAKIQDGAVTSTKILDGTIATADIANDAVTMAKINQSGATTGQVIKWTGTAWVPRSDSLGGLTLPFQDSIAVASGPVFQATNTNSNTPNMGVFGKSNSPSGRGVYGQGPYYGVHGYATDTSLQGIGVLGTSASASGRGVYGSALYSGVTGVGSATSGLNYGVIGQANSPLGRGVHGQAVDASGGIGVYGTSFSSSGQAGYFLGNVIVTGTLSKGGGSFKIDHPLDPANKYLYHSFVESPDMMDIYNGNVVLDGSGEAWVQLSDWFGALNKEFRYQLTCIGGFAPVFIAQEIQNNRFQIAGGSPGMKVSWQITGIRKDAFAEKYRIPVEEDKKGDERGRYMHPEAFGLSKDMAIPLNQLPKPSGSNQ